MTEGPEESSGSAFSGANEGLGPQVFVPSSRQDVIAISNQKIKEDDARSARRRNDIGFNTLLALVVLSFVIAFYLSVWGDSDTQGWSQGIFAGILGAVLGAIAGYVTGNASRT